MNTLRESTNTDYVSVAPRNEWSAGATTLLASFLAMATSWNVVSVALSVFLKPMQAELGWTRIELSIAPLAGLITAFMLPFTGLLLDRFGPRKVALCGTLMMAITLRLFGFLPPGPFAFAALIFMLAIAGSTINSLVLARGVANWFQRRLGTALGILFAGASVALALLIPIISGIVNESGWRTGFLVYSGIAILFSFPILFALVREPRHQLAFTGGLAAPDRFIALLAQPNFWKLASASLIAAIPIGGVINHLIPLLTDRGMNIAQAAQLGSVFAIAIGIGGLITGTLYDRLHPPLVTAVILALAAGGTAMLWILPVGNAETAVAFSALLAVGLTGLATGTEGNYIMYFSNRLFGLRNFSRVTTLLGLVISIGMAAGGLVFALVFDTTGAYNLALVGSIALYLVAAGVFLTISLPKRSHAL
ncbi:MFS transporter [Pseudomonas fluorescens]|uniref:Major facilitator superfamily (MFS) profile domain-containing protein n=1 Tax=Pseudomonas fluorescens TaxID=294 RepID=A0A5E7CF73_PSEFL|nr:MFS transporter [Pseudomonas fluorescens]VVO03410.1 hypothetical protein PS833_02845 [Pseudomonas fluorescens]